MNMNQPDDLGNALHAEELPIDGKLKSLKRDQILELTPFERLRWFHLLQVSHAELRRVIGDVLELLEGDAETRIVALVGMTAAGKTTGMKAVKNALTKRYRTGATPGVADIPVLSICAPANGEHSLSWRVVYTRMLQNGGEEVHKRSKGVLEVAGRLEYTKGSISVAQLRQFLEHMIRARNIRVVMVD
jgi:hypothetical protein